MATPLWVQSKGVGAYDSNTLTLSVTAPDTVVVYAYGNALSPAVTVTTNNGTLTPTSVSNYQATAPALSISVWLLTGASGSTTLSFSCPAQNFVGYAHEFSGVSAMRGITPFNGATGGVATSFGPGALTTVSGDLVVLLAGDSNDTAISAVTGTFFYTPGATYGLGYDVAQSQTATGSSTSPLVHLPAVYENYYGVGIVLEGASSGPTITGQPSNQTVTAPATATFSVSATASAGSLSYQWHKNGSAITGATNASYTTPATTTADSGETFDVVVTDSNGSVTSNTVTLTVNAATNALSSPISTSPAIASTLQASQGLQNSVQASPAALGALAASVAMSCSATILPRTGAALAQQQGLAAAIVGETLVQGSGGLSQVFKTALALSPSIFSSAQAFQNLRALVDTAPQVVGTFTVTTPGQVNLGASISVAPSMVGAMTASQGVAGAILLTPSFSGRASLTQGLSAKVALPPQVAGVLSLVTPGVISLAGAITIQPGMGGYLQASQTSVGASTATPGVAGRMTSVNQLSGASSLTPSVAGLWLSFLHMGSSVAAPFGVRGSAYAWQTLQGDVSVTPSVLGAITPTFTGYPVDPNFYLALPPRTFTVTLDGRVLYVAMPPRSFYILDNDTMAAQTFPALFDPAESDTVTFDKTQDLIAGETLVSLAGALEVSVLIGIDPTPSSHFGIPAINPLVLPAQPPRQPTQIGAGCGLQIPVDNTVVDGCSYLIRQPCATSLGRVMTVKGILKVSSQ